MGYSGRDMVSVHTRLGISEDHWRCFLGHASETMEELQTPHQEREELVTFVTSIKSGIVGI